MEKTIPFPRGQPKRRLLTRKHKTRSHVSAAAQPPEEEPDTQSLRRENKEGQTEIDLPPQGKEEKKTLPPLHPWEPVLYVAAKLVLVVGIVWLLFSQVFAIYHVSGQAMYPNVLDGDFVVGYRLESSFAQDDVVIYRRSGIWWVGRIVAQAGDVVDFTEDGYLTVNGNIQQEEKVYYASETDMLSVDFPYTVPEDSYFVLNDYRTYGAYDSRQWGAIPQSDLVAKVISLWRFRGV
jgi:signal peptidase I